MPYCVNLSIGKVYRFQSYEILSNAILPIKIRRDALFLEHVNRLLVAQSHKFSV